MYSVLNTAFTAFCTLIFLGSAVTGTAALKDHLMTIPHEEGHSFGPIEKIYVINLKERPEKWAAVCKELHPYGVFPQRVDAFNGWKAPYSVINDCGIRAGAHVRRDLMSSHFVLDHGQERLIDDYIRRPGFSHYGHRTSRSVIAIVISHLSVLLDAAKNNYSVIWSMEDDVKVHRDPQEIIGLLNRINQIDPEWDAFFTDPDTKNANGQYIPARALAQRPDYNLPPLEYFLSKCKTIDADLSQTGMRYGAYSIIWSQRGLKKVLNYLCTHNMYLPYDFELWMAPDMHLYTMNYDLVSTEPRALSDNGAPRYSQP